MAMITNVALIVCALLVASGLGTNAMTYDYSANTECLVKPESAQYKGGIIENPELNDGLKGWFPFGSAKIEHREESNGNVFIVAHTRNHSYDTLSQTLHLHSNIIYTFSAWVQVNEGKADVAAVIKTKRGYEHVAATTAQSNCWSFFKGGLTVTEPGPVELYFESNNTNVEIWMDSVSLQPFTQEQWRAHQDQAIEKYRKRTVKIQVLNKEGYPLPNVTISLGQWRPGFPVGCAINRNILNNFPYQNWFLSRFTTTTFENEMKWYSNEQTRGHVDYSVSDAMIYFTKQHNIAVRGHNVFWNDPQYVQGWVKSLSNTDLYRAARRRLDSVMSKYRGQVIAWDVENENLHFNFFESKLGWPASGLFYNWAMKADQSIPLFLNEFNTIESSGDAASSPARYLQKLDAIRKFPGNSDARFAIGLESHFGPSPNLAYMRSAIDTLGSAGVPIWLTEVDVSNSGNQAYDLEQVLREGFSHPKVNGIVIWSAWAPWGCYRMCLTDNNFNNLPTGDVVDKLLKEWGIKGSITATTDSNGFFETSLFHGEYEMKILHPSVTESSINAQKFSVLPGSEGESEQQSPLLIQVEV
ncbi:endo-1,4-beta-xylanase 5-like [Cucumis melo]|uniref:Endo-1,4-beta-xylanase 5-like n=1 Tax=Cucumis melo TaxID=3656 RepID=A0A1S3C1U4_CUCME|nr:endo-1,4-beta-xylanase 5-like [Cucumis melo]